MFKRKIICILLAIILMSSTSIVSLASNVSGNVQTNSQSTSQNEKTNSENSNSQENSVQNKTLTQEERDEIAKQKQELSSKLEEANSKLEYVQGEISNALLEIQKLSDKITKYESENQDLGQQLSTLETSVKETSRLLETVTADYIRKEDQLKERLVTIYEEGELSYLDLLLSSTSLYEFLSRYYYMQEIAEYDNKLIDKVAEEKDTIETSKKKLENETAQIKILKAKAEQTEIVLRNTKTLFEGQVEQLTESEKQLNDEITVYKIENAKLEAKLQEVSLNFDNIDIQYTGGAMIWPVAKAGTVITSRYGTRTHPISGIVKLHQGLDIAASTGSPAVSALDGVVTYAGWLGSYGNCVMIYHGNGITTVYGHGDRVLTEKGKEVKQGEVIMAVGSTGNSTGPHLHFEVRVNGATTDPLQFVKAP